MSPNCPYFRCPYPKHDACWREYERDTDRQKYVGAE